MKYFTSLVAAPQFNSVFHHSLRRVALRGEAGAGSGAGGHYSITQTENVCQKQHNLCVTINTHMHIDSNNIR
jgi:hypothetical protein